MGRTKKNKPRRKSDHPHQRRDAATAAAQIAWTPLKQECGCVVDWGWLRDTANPLAFRDWYISQLSMPCPWHTGSEAGTDGGALPDVLTMRPEPTVLLHARKAAGRHLALGAELATRLADVLDKAQQADTVLLDGAPAGFRSWLIAKATDPAQAWLEHELTDIILNQGRTALPRELLERLPERLLAPMASPQSDSETCNVCSFSAAHGGVLCVCGHDWSCHPGKVADGEPCSHCACPSMRHL